MLVCVFVHPCVHLFCVYVREKYTLEQDIRETEEAIRHKSVEVQVRANQAQTAFILPLCFNFQRNIRTITVCLGPAYMVFLYSVYEVH